MDLSDVGKLLANVGGSILKNAFPPISGIAFDAINAVLPVAERLGDEATGTDALASIKTLPPAEQANLMIMKLEVEKTEIQEFTKVQAVLADVDKVGASTRPKIAMMMAWLVFATGGLSIIALSYTVFAENTETLKELMNAWPLILAMLGPATALLQQYFGMRMKEKTKRYEMAGAPQQTGWMSQVIQSLKK